VRTVIGDNFIGKRIDNQIDYRIETLSPSSSLAPLIPLVDGYPNNTSLLLHMNGVNGSQAFIDNSINNFTVIANGNVQISTNEKKFGNGSTYFDGNGDYLRTQIPYHNWNDDFTIEMWIKKIDGGPTSQTIFEAGDIQTEYGGINIYIQNGTIYFNNGLSADIGGVGSIVNNVWTNIVISRSSGTNYLFQDGVLIGSGTQTFPVLNNIISIGAAFNYGFSFKGYIDEVRITKGVARYTQNFIPQTAPFADPEIVALTDQYPNNTSLLLHMDGENNSTNFVDNSRYQVAITPFGNSKIINNLNDNSAAYFDGNGDYLRVINSNAYEFGGNDFTIECWFNIAETPEQYDEESDEYFITNTKTLFSKGSPETINSSTYVFEFYGVNQLGFYVLNYSGAVPLVGTTTHIQQNTWYHLAIVRNGSNTKLFLNGILESSNNSSYNISNGGDFVIGAGIYNIALRSLNCYVDEFRITKGVARYTQNFTPQLLPFQNIPYTPVTITTNGLVARFVAESLLQREDPVITYWEDENQDSNDNSYLTTAQAFNGPTVITNQLNGRPALSFNGVNNYLTFSIYGDQGDPGISLMQSRTFVVIGKYNNSATDQQQGFLNSEGDKSYIFQNGNRGYYKTKGNGQIVEQISGPQNLTLDRYHVTTVVHAFAAEGETSQSFIRINNQTIYMDTTGLIPDLNNFIIGARTTNSEFLNGSIVEILIYNRALTLQEIVQIENYANVPADGGIIDPYDTAATSSGFNIEQFLMSDVADEFVIPIKKIKKKNQH
jgi:Concanavalin A-like lectin/glucanases superfamily